MTLPPRVFSALVLCLILAGCFDYSDGERIGTVVKFSQKGIICKTWEGEMMLGGLDAGTGAIGRTWSFTIEDPKLVAALQQAIGKQVTVTYRQELLTFCRSDSVGDYFVTAVKAVHP